MEFPGSKIFDKRQSNTDESQDKPGKTAA